MRFIILFLSKVQHKFTRGTHIVIFYKEKCLVIAYQGGSQEFNMNLKTFFRVDTNWVGFVFLVWTNAFWAVECVFV